MSFAKATIYGNLTRDPEIRVTPSGQQIAQFTVGVNRKWKDANGQAREKASFIDCEAWGKTAENIAKFFGKGDPIYVEGRLEQDQWEDKTTGQKRSRLKVSVDSWEFMGSKKDRDQQPSEQQEAPPPQRQSQPAPKQEGLDEDVPF